MTTVNTNATQTIEALFTDLRRGANDVVIGSDKLDVGRGMLTASLLLIAAADTDYRAQMVARATALICKRTDENKEEVDGARVYFRDLFVGTAALADRLKQTDEEDRITRERHNNKVQALDASAMFAAYCIVTINHYSAWSYLEASKKKGAIKMLTAGVSLIWPSKQKTLDEMDEKSITISNRAGAWRMSSLEAMGREIALVKGLRTKTPTKATSVGDAALALFNSVEAADVKAVNTNIDARINVFSVMVSLVDLLNDKTFTQHIGNDVVAPFRAKVVAAMEAAQAERIAKVTPKAA